MFLFSSLKIEIKVSLYNIVKSGFDPYDCYVQVRFVTRRRVIVLEWTFPAKKFVDLAFL